MNEKADVKTDSVKKDEVEHLDDDGRYTVLIARHLDLLRINASAFLTCQ